MDCCPWSYASIWNTREVSEALRAKRTQDMPTWDDATTLLQPDMPSEDTVPSAWPDEYPYEPMLSAAE